MMDHVAGLTKVSPGNRQSGRGISSTGGDFAALLLPVGTVAPDVFGQAANASQPVAGTDSATPFGPQADLAGQPGPRGPELSRSIDDAEPVDPVTGDPVSGDLASLVAAPWATAIARTPDPVTATSLANPSSAGIEAETVAAPDAASSLLAQSDQKQPVHGSPIQGSPTQGSPIQAPPIQGSPVEGRPIPGQAFQGNPAGFGLVSAGPTSGPLQPTIGPRDAPSRAPSDVGADQLEPAEPSARLRPAERSPVTGAALPRGEGTSAAVRLVSQASQPPLTLTPAPNPASTSSSPSVDPAIPATQAAEAGAPIPGPDRSAPAPLARGVPEPTRSGPVELAPPVGTPGARLAAAHAQGHVSATSRRSDGVKGAGVSAEAGSASPVAHGAPVSGAMAARQPEAAVLVAHNLPTDPGSEAPLDIGLDGASELVSHDAARSDRTAAVPEAVRARPASQQVLQAVVARLNGGSTQFTVRLDPAELGRVEVRLRFDAQGRIDLHIEAEEGAALDALVREVRVLERAFSELGLRVSEDGIRFSLKSGGHDGHERGQGPPLNSGVQSRTLPDGEDAERAGPSPIQIERWRHARLAIVV